MRICHQPVDRRREFPLARRMKKLLILALTFSCLLRFSVAGPEEAAFHFDQAIQSSYNPLGLQSVTQFFFRLPLSQSNELLFKTQKLDIGLLNNLSPGYNFIGPYIDFEPIAFFTLTASAQFTGYFNWFGYGFYDLNGYNAGFNDDHLSRVGSRNEFGTLLSVSPTFRFALDRKSVV